MMQTKNLRGECQHCGGAIEFQADATGTTAACPHCGRATELMLALPPDIGSPVRTKAIVFTLIALVILLGGLGGAVLALKRAQRLSSRQPAATVNTSTNAPAKPVDPFAALGFRVSPVTLEKGAGSALVYATGNIVNVASRQRFGVRVELDLLDAASNKLGSATDYRPTLEPGAEWRYRALVVDKKAASAKVAAIKEDH